MGDRIYINGEFYMGDRIMDRLAKSYIKDIVSTLDDLPIGDREAYLLALIYEMKYEEIMNQEKLDNEVNSLKEDKKQLNDDITNLIWQGQY